MSVDLALFQSTSNPAVVLQVLASPINNGYTVTGPLKLIQRFLIELLTEKGSLVYLPNRGTQFVPLLKAGAASSWDVLSAFAIAALDVSNNLTKEESDADPDDERFASAEMSEITLSEGSVSAKLSVKNRAGTVLNIVLPLSFLVS